MNANDQKRENRLRLVEDHIGRSLAESEKSGELKSAPNYGKLLNFGDGYAETPEELRMGFKMTSLADGRSAAFRNSELAGFVLTSRVSMPHSPYGLCAVSY